MMNEDKPEQDEPRTIFDPGAGPAAIGAAGGETPTARVAPEEPAWGAARPAATPPAGVEPPATPAPQPSTGETSLDRTFVPSALRGDGRSIVVGDVLNHIFEVKRFIARGGMGEVYEGVNVSSDERVAIKVMLPSLAADPNVQAMFRKEAKTLTRLAHPALVQYRVLAQEPQLGVLYIVTEYIDGTNLSDVLGSFKVSATELRELARRLASGLKVAHALGAIHRDISPDNVLLEDGKLEQAKIIDFGIAKDLDTSVKTIVGDGFAGKLNYVAPEQLGDFGRDVGQWSDVYSLGLVLLAVAQGHSANMGATMVDAVDRRRAGIDLAQVPDEMRGVLEAMLVPDPANRLRSMDAVIEALDKAPGKAGAGGASARAAAPSSDARKATKPSRADKAEEGGNGKQMMLIGGGVAALLVLAVAVWLAMGASGMKGGSILAGTGTPDAAAASTAISAALPRIDCAWLDVAESKAGDGGVAVTMHGAARDPASAQGAISRALSDAGVAKPSVAVDDVATAPADVCGALDAFRAFRDPDSSKLTVEKPTFELGKTAEGTLAADAAIGIDRGGSNSEIAIIGIKPNGEIDQIEIDSSETLDAFATANPDRFTREGNRYRALLSTDHTGLSGVLRLESSAALSAADKALLTLKPAARGNDWADRIADSARRGKWKIDMVWYRTMDDVPG